LRVHFFPLSSINFGRFFNWIPPFLPSLSKKFRFESHALNNVCDAEFEDKVRGYELIKVKKHKKGWGGVGGWEY
jgi:hypothetical protein